MALSFETFYADPGYRQFKRHLFNFLLRKRKIAAFLGRPRGLVLEIGCGITPMSPAGSRVIVADRSLLAIKTLASNHRLPAVLDICTLGLRNAAVGTVVCSEVLEHVGDDQEALKEIHRVLTDCGTLILTVPIHQHYWRQDDEIVGHRRRYDPRVLEADLTRIGFTVLKRAKVGSLLERYLTLAAVGTFLRKPSSSFCESRWGLLMFSAANRAAARVLQLAALVSPERFNSIELFYCRKN
ncbi:MAG: class I SAM-dependent methyltransferase [Acidobacteria bacterium]|nr:class I SAM-dependent methyltransferase [Acidobacteriota bacterium]